MSVTLKDIKGDFRNFLYLIWKHLGLPDPTPIQYEIAYYLQHGPKRKIIEAFRGVGKSWITSAYVLWRLLRNPDDKFLIVSASKQRSDDFSSFTKRLINEVPILQHLKPNITQRDSMVAFDVGPAKPAHSPSVKSVGIFGQLTGSRAVEIIADDVEVPNNSATQDMRDKLIKTCMEFEAIIMPDVGQITYLGTPQTEESIYNKLRERGYKTRIWPARYPQPDKIRFYEGCLADTIISKLEADPSLIGHSTDPQRFNDIDLIERETAYGRSGFALQFMLDTSLSDAEKYPLKLSDLIVMSLDVDKGPISLSWASSPDLQYKEIPNLGFSGDRLYQPLRIDPEWIPYEGSCMAIDPSGRGADETTYAVVKQLHGYLYVTALGGFKGGYGDEVLTNLAKIAKQQKVNQIVIESNFGDGMFTKLFEPVLTKYHPCAVEEIRHNTQKERRIIDTLEPVMNSHKLVMDLIIIRDDYKLVQSEEITIDYSLQYQLTRMTKERGALKHDDRVDVLAMAVAYWVESMARNEEDAIDAYKEDKLNKEIATFLEHCLGGTLTNTHDLRDVWLRG